MLELNKRQNYQNSMTNLLVIEEQLVVQRHVDVLIGAVFLFVKLFTVKNMRTTVHGNSIRSLRMPYTEKFCKNYYTNKRT